MREVHDIVSDELLQRYVDGELPEQQLLEIREAIQQNPELGRRVDEYQQLSTLVSGLHRSVLSEPVPEHLKIPLNRTGVRNIAAMAAGFVLFCMGVLVGLNWSSFSGGAGQSLLIGNAVAAHKLYTGEILHPVEVKYTESEHLQKWLSKQIGVHIKLPNVESEGLRLVGGRLLPGDAISPHGLLIYEKDSGERISVYITRTGDQPHTSTLFEQQDNLAVFYWIDEELSCAVVIAMNAEFDHANSLDLSNDIYEQLEL